MNETWITAQFLVINKLSEHTPISDFLSVLLITYKLQLKDVYVRCGL